MTFLFFIHEGFARKYAAIVMDANSGKIICGANHYDNLYPASLTKLMTLYLLFEQLDKKIIRLNTPFKVSDMAAGQSPSKIGIFPVQPDPDRSNRRGRV